MLLCWRYAVASPSTYGSLGAELARARRAGDTEAEAAIRRRLAVAALSDRIAAVRADHDLSDDDRLVLLAALA